MRKKIIYAVEDNKSISDMYKIAFEGDEYQVETFSNAEDMFGELKKELCDIVLMDIILEQDKMDGLEAIKKLKSTPEYENIPCIVISAKGEEKNKIEGLNLGADDYMAKPFSIDELGARIKANIRQASKNVKNKNSVDIDIDRDTKRISINGNFLDLTQKEYELFTYLYDKRGEIVTRETLFKEVWEYVYLGKTRTLDMHIMGLRKKIAQFTKEHLIITIRGKGYKFID